MRGYYQLKRNLRINIKMSDIETVDDKYSDDNRPHPLFIMWKWWNELSAKDKYPIVKAQYEKRNRCKECGPIKDE